MKATTILALIFAAMVMTVVLLSLSYPDIARFGPLVVGVPALVLLLFQIFRENFGSEAKSQSSNTVAKMGQVTTKPETTRRYIEIGVWVIGLVAATYLLGIVVAFPLFTFAYLKGHGEGWLRAILISVVLFALFYGVFGKVLEVYLYKGILLE